MRLIDADELKEWITGHCDIELDEATEGEILRVIDDQFTAFNMDNVVESLYEIRNELLHNTGYDSEIINWCLDWFDRAIEIVKGAVKDEEGKCKFCRCAICRWQATYNCLHDRRPPCSLCGPKGNMKHSDIVGQCKGFVKRKVNYDE